MYVPTRLLTCYKYIALASKLNRPNAGTRDFNRRLSYNGRISSIFLYINMKQLYMRHLPSETAKHETYQGQWEQITAYFTLQIPTELLLLGAG